MEYKLPKGITRRGKKFRVSIMVDGNRKGGTYKTLELAMENEAVFRLGLDDLSSVTEHAVWNVATAWENYVDFRVANAVGNKTSHQKFTWYGKIILNFFGPLLSLDEISKVKVTEFYDYLTVDKKYSASCTNYLGTMLHQMQLFSKKRGRKRIEPERMECRKAEKGRIRFVTELEESRILEFWRGAAMDDNADLFSFYVDTGMRKSEGLGLKFKDCDMKTGRMTIWQTKTNQPRSIKMTNRVRSIVASLKMRGHNEFLTEKDRENRTVFGHIAERRFYKDWVGMREILNFDPDLVIHTLRHTCCTRLLGAGVNIRTTQEWMGHSDIKMTQRYAHFIPRTLDEAADALDALAVEKMDTTVTQFRTNNLV